MKQVKTRRLNKNAPKAKAHKPKKGKGSYSKKLKDFLINTLFGDL